MDNRMILMYQKNMMKHEKEVWPVLRNEFYIIKNYIYYYSI
jgi:hypothetical protein